MKIPNYDKTRCTRRSGYTLQFRKAESGKYQRRSDYTTRREEISIVKFCWGGSPMWRLNIKALQSYLKLFEWHS